MNPAGPVKTDNIIVAPFIIAPEISINGTAIIILKKSIGGISEIISIKYSSIFKFLLHDLI